MCEHLTLTPSPQEGRFSLVASASFDVLMVTCLKKGSAFFVMGLAPQVGQLGGAEI